MDYSRHVSSRRTHQQHPIFGREHEMARNHAGGQTFKISPWERLERFLVLGTEGGTYYCNERQQTQQEAPSVLECIKLDPKRTVKTIVQISDEGRGIKNDAAIFALAVCAAQPETKQAALAALPKVCRIGTHLFSFVQTMEQFRGWGRAAKRAIANWYLDKPAHKAAYQMVKYQQRNGWSHRDLLRLSHPKTDDPAGNALFKWATKGILDDAVPKLVKTFEAAKDPRNAVWAAQEGLTREMLPTESLKDPKVWEALLPAMPLTALVRNLGVMAARGILAPFCSSVELVAEKLTNEEHIKKSRLHPMSILVASKIYAEGKGMKGSLSWEPNAQILDALGDAFYLAFQNVEPVGKNIVIGLDVSGSMGWNEISGCPISPREAGAALATVWTRTEPKVATMAFAGEFMKLPITPKTSLQDAVGMTSGLRFGRTDCALPMLWAIEHNIKEADAFVIITDNETWAGNIHPCQALQEYRRFSGRDAKLAVVAMTVSEFSIADPSDPGMMDFVGFDTALPLALAEFLK